MATGRDEKNIKKTKVKVEKGENKVEKGSAVGGLPGFFIFLFLFLSLYGYCSFDHLVV